MAFYQAYFAIFPTWVSDRLYTLPMESLASKFCPLIESNWVEGGEGGSTKDIPTFTKRTISTRNLEGGASEI